MTTLVLAVLVTSGLLAGPALASQTEPIGNAGREGRVSLPQPGSGKPLDLGRARAAASDSIPAGARGPAQAGVPIQTGNIRLTGPSDNTQAEISMASSGTSIVITFNDFTGNGASFVTSTNGGATFSAKANPPVPAGSVPCCDSSIVADNGGNFYFLQLYRDDGAANNCTNSLHVSTNGGATFGGIVGSPFSYASGTADFPDQPHMGIDKVNLVGGQPQLYTFTRHFTSGINCPQTGGGGLVQGEVTCSTNGGANWAAPTVLSPFTDLAHWGVGTDGSTYLAGVGSGGSILLRRSTNTCQAGIAFGSPVTVASGLTFSGVGIDREFPQPQVVVDRVNPNIAYVVYSADRTSGTNDRDIFLAACTFTGTTGTCAAPVRINDNPTTDNTSQYFPMPCIDPANTVRVSWNDRRLDATNNQQTAVFYTEVTGNGATVAPNVRIDEATFAPVNFGGTPDYGDYNENNDACDANHFYAAWSSQVSPPGITPASTDVDVFFTVVEENRPPTVDAGPDVSGDEGSPIPLDGTASDPNGTALTTSWTFTPGAGVDPGATCSFADPSAVDTTVTCTDDGTYTVTLTASDGVNPPVSDSATVTVANVAPTLTITAPTDGQLFKAPATVNLSAPITDPGTNDTHTCLVNWDDGVIESFPGTGTCTRSHTFTGAGVYTITVTVTDDDGGTASRIVTVVVFDPGAGFVTGGGFINSPPGAYVPDPSLTGEAHFNFEARYKQNASVPSGSTRFRFNAAGLRFRSTSYQWLVVTGAKAQIRGSGTVNGGGSYGFLLTAYDGGSGGNDRFRIKIWNLTSGSVLYDNRPAAPDDIDTANPQPIAGGSIQIHP
jgi:PKD domain